MSITETHNTVGKKRRQVF